MPTHAPAIRTDVPITTWFKVGGAADRYAEPESAAELAALVNEHDTVRVLGDGANLLVHDDGIDGLVVKLAGELASWSIDADTGTVTVGAGVNLPKLIHETVRHGLRGLETLGGVPATIGGAIAMNAGGKYGNIGPLVDRVRAIDAQGHTVTRTNAELRFDYRAANTDGLLITSAVLNLTPGADRDELRDTLKEIMLEKKHAQPLAAKSCGCVFKNPALPANHPDFGPAGSRVAAGRLIDLAGCKGLTADSGHVRVSEVHANFFETSPAAKAADILELIERVRSIVHDRFDIELHTELVIWQRGGSSIAGGTP